MSDREDVERVREALRHDLAHGAFYTETPAEAALDRIERSLREAREALGPLVDDLARRAYNENRAGTTWALIERGRAALAATPSVPPIEYLDMATGITEPGQIPQEQPAVPPTPERDK